MADLLRGALTRAARDAARRGFPSRRRRGRGRGTRAGRATFNGTERFTGDVRGDVRSSDDE